ncbi:hypothetical protein AB0M39_26610 [Streptomyces sp. NPDC051907]|uniref:hypothetical protein n=1 Tax=Streptomyces sp. NPDC051907 TaxID=3155284 RepID=UPI003420C370
MAGDLTGHSSAGLKPAQRGAVTGTAASGGQPHRVSVEWLVDTGSDVSTVSDAVAAQFALRPAGIGTTAQGVGGGLRLLPRRGLTVEFEVEDANGQPQQQAQPTIVFVGGTGAILGMHELVVVNAAISWRPKSSFGHLRTP